MKPSKLTWRISVMLAVSMGLLVVFAVLAVLSTQMWVTRKNTFDLLNQKAASILRGIEIDIAAHLNPVGDQLEFIARQIETGAFDIHDRQRLSDLLTGAVAPLPQIDRIVILDTALQALAVHRVQNNGIKITYVDRSKEPVVLKIRDRLKSETKAIWGDLIYFNGVTYISLQRALRRDGVLIGYIGTTISTTILSELIEEASNTLSASLDDGSGSILATAYILYGPGHVLAHPNLVGDNSRQSMANPVAKISDVGDLVLAELSTGILVPGFEKAAAKNVNVVGIELREERYIAIYRWLESYGDTPWGIGMWTRASDLNAELKRLQTAGYIGIGVALLAVLAAVIVGRRIARPIRTISSNAVKIGDFDLKEIKDLPPSRIRELNDESIAFNKMLAGLRSFETYVPRALVARLMRTGGGAAITSEQRRITVMFTDIVGYTASSENQSAIQVAQFLNDHFSLLGSCVEAEGGTIDKFIGDSLMAFWGAPESQEHIEARASRAAMAIATAIEEENETRGQSGEPAIRIRIGVHTGAAVVGNIGAPGRINYTIVGDTVNTCQRLEALGKEIDPAADVIVLLSRSTADELDERFRIESVGEFKVKGRVEKIEVFRLRDFNDDTG